MPEEEGTMEYLEGRKEFLTRPFALAYFLHGDEKLAWQITLETLTRLEVMAERQEKRHYRSLKKRPNKVILSKSHLLQYLVYLEYERHEKLSQAHGAVGDESLIVWYVKYLVRLSIEHHLLYVVMAIGRFLYRYNTKEIMAIYDLLSQNPECQYEGEYYRARKGVFLKRLRERFDPLVETCRGPRDEEFFLNRVTSDQHVELVEQCLSKFTPWETSCPVPEGFRLGHELPELEDDGTDRERWSRTEIARIHSVLHPECFRRVTQALGLEPPERRLALPHFFLDRSARGIDPVASSSIGSRAAQPRPGSTRP